MALDVIVADHVQDLAGLVDAGIVTQIFFYLYECLNWLLHWGTSSTMMLRVCPHTTGNGAGSFTVDNEILIPQSTLLISSLITSLSNH